MHHWMFSPFWILNPKLPSLWSLVKYISRLQSVCFLRQASETLSMPSHRTQLRLEQEACIKRKEVEGVVPAMGELLRSKLARGSGSRVRLRDLTLPSREDAASSRPGRGTPQTFQRV